MSVLADIGSALWIFFTGAAAARIAFWPRKKPAIKLHIDTYLNTTKKETQS